MIPPSVLRYLPYVALGVGAILFGVFLRYAIKSVALQRRRVLFGAVMVAALGPLYVGLVWASLVPDSYLRLARPWMLVVGFAAVAFIAVRLARLTTRQTPARAALSDFFATFAALAGDAGGRGAGDRGAARSIGSRSCSRSIGAGRSIWCRAQISGSRRS